MAKKGDHFNGVRTVDDIRRRCRVTEECWHWLKATTKKGVPKLWFSPLDRETTIGPVLYFMRHGKAPQKGRIYSTFCGSLDCANPDHYRLETLSSACKRHKRKNPLVHRQRGTLARRARSTKMNEEKAAEIRASSESLESLAKAYGISYGHAWRIKTGKHWMPLQPASPFAGLL